MPLLIIVRPEDLDNHLPQLPQETTPVHTRLAAHRIALKLDKPEITRTQTKAHPVAGQIPRISDRVKMRDEPKLEGKPNPVDRVQAERVGRKDSRSGRQIVQPTSSPAQNEKLAARNAPDLETKISAISSVVPGA